MIFQLQQAGKHMPSTNRWKSQAPTSQIKKTNSYQPTTHLDPKRRNTCTLDGEQSTKSCLKSSVLLICWLVICRLQILHILAPGQSWQACPMGSSVCSYNTEIPCGEHEILTSRHNQFLATHEGWLPWSRLGVDVLNHNTVHRKSGLFGHVSHCSGHKSSNDSSLRRPRRLCTARVGYMP